MNQRWLNTTSTYKYKYMQEDVLFYWCSDWKKKICRSAVILLTHLGWVMQIYLSNLTIIGSDNGLSPSQHRAITWSSAGILLIAPLGTNFTEISIWIEIFLGKKMVLKVLSGKSRPFCLGLNVLTIEAGTLEQNGHHFTDNIFLHENCYILVKFSLKFVAKGPSEQ